MSQRVSGYVRKELDAYETPEWVTLALMPHIPERIKAIWEPACGNGKMVRILETKFGVLGTDIEDEYNRDFFDGDLPVVYDAIITNPPYKFAVGFIRNSIEWTRERSGFVAMLLRTDFDHAKTRLHLFNSEPFSKKIILTKRIRWIEDSTGSPSFNHAWFCWDWMHKGPPELAYHQ